MTKHSDIHIIEEVISGNTSAYRQLVESHQNNVYNIVYRIVQNTEDAEEISQDVFVKVFNALNTFQEKSKFSTWLYRVAYNAAISHYRKKKVIQMPINDEVLEIEVENSFFDDFEDIEALKHEYLPVAIEKLTNQDQLLISMYYQQDLSINEISEITGTSKSNTKIKLFRARKFLYNYISEMMKSFTNAV